MTGREDRRAGRSGRPTIREVSRLSGVSVATVSRVLHGQTGRFSAETEERVREAMDRLNYEPDLLAQGMRRQALPVVGVIMPDILDDSMALMMRTVQEVLFERNYSTVFFNSDESRDRSQRYLDMLHAQHAAGVIYVPDRDGDDLETHGMPLICFDRMPASALSARSVRIVQSNYESARDAALWMAESGCRRVVVLGDRYHIPMHTLRLQGALDGLRACEAECAGVLGVDPQKTSEAVIEVARAIDGGMSFDGIFCASVRLTVGAMSAIRERNLEDSIRVAGYGVHRLYRYGLIDYMAIYEPIREMAVAAANGMLAMIRGEAIPEEQVFASRRLATREDALSTIS